MPPERSARSWPRDARARVVRPRVLAVAILFAGLAVTGSGQSSTSDQRPTFRTRTDLVLLDVSVLDRDRRPIHGLTATDFTVLDSGVEQPIASFAAIDLPAWPDSAAAWTREIGPDVASNRLDARRAVVIVFDDVHTWRDPDAARRARSVARGVIDELGPSDLAAVVFVLAQKQGQEFTTDRVTLRAAVDRFVPSGLFGPLENPWQASTPGSNLLRPSRLGVPSGACMRDCVAESLLNVAKILTAWPDARKTMVLIAPGRQPARIDDNFEENDERARLFDAAQQANVNIYQFDPHGLQTGPQPFTDFGTFAENTGGRTFTNTNDPQDLVPQMFRENSSYYLLGIKPSSGTLDGRFHRLTVRVDRPDAQVRTRAGYYAIDDRPRATATPPIAVAGRALSGGLPMGDLPLSLTVSPFATAGTPGAALAIAARLDVDAALAAGGIVELTAVAFRDDWKPIADVTQRFELPATQPSLPSRELAIRLDVPPGRYEIRAAASHPADARTGSVYASVVVPDFAREPLSLSGVVVDRQFSGATMPDALTSLVPVHMTTRRAFAPSDHVIAFARVYQRRAKTAAPARVTARIVDARDQIAWTTDTTLEPSAFGAQRQADVHLDLPLDRLADGDYLLTIDATSASASARRDVRFSVRR
jgi:VWFA-related protein